MAALRSVAGDAGVRRSWWRQRRQTGEGRRRRAAAASSDGGTHARYGTPDSVTCAADRAPATPSPTGIPPHLATASPLPAPISATPDTALLLERSHRPLAMHAQPRLASVSDTRRLSSLADATISGVLCGTRSSPPVDATGSAYRRTHVSNLT
ncbi:uncharacterized protein LAESUDRAFT_765441 [Laetiporus sulphureus 93-53]|uniref:Uncharacterized protein n=1 Tax=Laetiporus sulphureus 93-53 TaxID=1314785 RepID=A0A165ARK6_9APHY|nr:uncharacterized protein LAESUDRAFT_765441 [Laetiporus sulphureus 93-53]KZS99522.1 hypothetical protein LAESUDRAFT_765441 [Laetiporus sulphureus 93-53]